MRIYGFPGGRGGPPPVDPKQLRPLATSSRCVPISLIGPIDLPTDTPSVRHRGRPSWRGQARAGAVGRSRPPAPRRAIRTTRAQGTPSRRRRPHPNVIPRGRARARLVGSHMSQKVHWAAEPRQSGRQPPIPAASPLAPPEWRGPRVRCEFGQSYRGRRNPRRCHDGIRAPVCARAGLPEDTVGGCGDPSRTRRQLGELIAPRR